MGAPKYIKQLLTDIKEEINSNTIIVEDFNTPLTSMDRLFRQNQQGNSGLDVTLDQMSLTYIPVSYTHLTLPTTCRGCRSRWSPYH